MFLICCTGGFSAGVMMHSSITDERGLDLGYITQKLEFDRKTGRIIYCFFVKSLLHALISMEKH